MSNAKKRVEEYHPKLAYQLVELTNKVNNMLNNVDTWGDVAMAAETIVKLKELNQFLDVYRG